MRATLPASAVKDVLSIVPEVAAAVPSVTFVLACREKHAGQKQERQRWQSLVSRETWGRQVRFYGETPRIRDLLRACAVHLFPELQCRAKTDIPIVLLETLAAGRPVVIYDRPPISEVLQRPAGVSVPPSDVRALAAATIRLLRDAQLRAQFGAEGAPPSRRAVQRPGHDPGL